MADSEPPQGKQLSAQQLATQKEQAKSSEAARPVVRTILILVMLGLVVGGLYYYWSTKDLERTDDA